MTRALLHRPRHALLQHPAWTDEVGPWCVHRALPLPGTLCSWAVQGTSFTSLRPLFQPDFLSEALK